MIKYVFQCCVQFRDLARLLLYALVAKCLPVGRLFEVPLLGTFLLSCKQSQARLPLVQYGKSYHHPRPFRLVAIALTRVPRFKVLFAPQLLPFTTPSLPTTLLQRTPFVFGPLYLLDHHLRVSFEAFGVSCALIFRILTLHSTPSTPL
jgi:hypothetical protein